MSPQLDEHTTSLGSAEDELRDIQSALSVNEGEPLHTLLLTTVRELQRVDLDIHKLFDNSYLDSASGEELERLGAPVSVDRKTNESDEKLRKRIRATYAALLSAGTVDDIGTVALLLLETEPDAIEFDRAVNVTDPGTAVIRIETEIIEESPFTRSEIADILDTSAIGGHRVLVQETDVFTWGDDSRGWGTRWGVPLNPN